MQKLSGIKRAGIVSAVVALSTTLLLAVGCDSRPGLKLRFAAERALGGTVRTLEIPGVEPIDVFLDPNSLAITPIVLEKGLWEPGETALFVSSVEPGDVVVDVGANIGYFTLIAAQLVGPEGRVYAFDPDPFTFRLLERNVRLNGFENVVLEPKAASNQNGTTKFFFDDAIREDGRIYEPSVGVLAKVLDRSLARESVEVETVRLDDYFRDVEDEVDFIKLDTQGAEGVIVEGLQELVRKSPDVSLIVEFVPALLRDFDYAPAELLRNLESLEMPLHTIHPNVSERQIQPVTAEALLAKQTGEMLFLTRNR